LAQARPRLQSVTVIVTKQTPTPPEPAKNRRSRTPEIDRCLDRWDKPERLTVLERKFLTEKGFGRELEPTRKRGAKVSAKARATLLLEEVEFRELQVRLEPSERSALVRALYSRGRQPVALLDAALREILAEGVRALNDGDAHWQAWARQHPEEYDSLLGEVLGIIENQRVAKFAGERYPLGERKYYAERLKRLRAELGERFVEGTIDRAAAVRQWDKRRRDRTERRQRSQGASAPVAWTGGATAQTNLGVLQCQTRR
jgi:hypothetical protein